MSNEKHAGESCRPAQDSAWTPEVDHVPAMPYSIAGRARPFPVTDHFALGRAYGRVDADPEPASAVRPFGLTLSVPSTDTAGIDPTQLAYDEDRQVGLVRDGAGLVPLSRHTDGQTNTVTQGGDGQGTNKDSDTDQRED